MIRQFKLFLLDSHLVDCMFLKSCLYLLGCQMCWQIIIHSILLQFLYFCGIHWDLSFIISYFAYLGSVSLLGEFGQIFVNLVYPFKEQALGFIDFFYCFFLICFISSLILIVPFFWWLYVLFVLFLILFGGGEVWRTCLTMNF